jgi:hypothetical protein
LQKASAIHMLVVAILSVFATAGSSSTVVDASYEPSACVGLCVVLSPGYDHCETALSYPVPLSSMGTCYLWLSDFHVGNFMANITGVSTVATACVVNITNYKSDNTTQCLSADAAPAIIGVTSECKQISGGSAKLSSC